MYMHTLGVLEIKRCNHFVILKFPQMPSLFLFPETKITISRPSTSMRYCSVRLTPIVENSLLLSPIGVWLCLSPNVPDHSLYETLMLNIT